MKTLCSALLFAFVVSVGGAASAEPSGSEEQIQRWADEAYRHFEEGAYDQALALYRQARAAGGPTVLLYLIGRCHQKLGEWEAARDALRGFLALETASSEAHGRAEVALREVIDELSRGSLLVHVTPFGAEVLVDGEVVGQAPLPPLSLTPGEHEVFSRLEGRESAVVSVFVMGGRETRATFTIPEPPPPPPAPEPLPAAPARPVYSPWTWVTLGLGIACVAGGTTSYVLGELDHREVTEAAGYGTSGVTAMSYRRAASLRDSGDTKKMAGYVLWGVGGAALVSSTVLFILDATWSPDDAEPALSVGAAPLDDGALLTVRGGF